jgi:ATP-dependent DNA helicase RecQ
LKKVCVISKLTLTDEHTMQPGQAYWEEFHDAKAAGEPEYLVNPEVPRKVLREIFGYSDFRPTQQKAIHQVLAGQDCLLLMPTGGGKSLCYQIPSMLRTGVGVIVSPLIALMQDQVQGLLELGIRAAFINSTQSGQEKAEIERAIQQGRLDLLYVAPERLLMEHMLGLLDRVDVALFAIDEAHCVSQWGHDFRKEYQQLRILGERFPAVPRIALTATADQRTREEIISQLDLHHASHFVDSFDRPNIRYQISDSGGREALWKFISSEHPEDAGIVYCLSRNKVDEVAAWLNGKGRNALPYHAGMNDRARQQNQHRFLKEEGLIIVATIAFGMGIDKPDVRFVAHLNLPKNIEAYYQETGRAGRDGMPANAWMSYTLQDVILLRRIVESSDAPEHQIRVMQRKLDSMLSFCELVECRRQSLLAYFGEVLEQPCGNCDNCLTPPKSIDASDEARKALSCIYRTGQKFGVTYLAQVLTGSEDDRIQRNNHHQLSVFGIGSQWPATQWKSLYRQLIARGFIHVDDEYGSLTLNDSCRPLLKGEQTFLYRQMVKAAKSRKKNSAASIQLESGDLDLFEQLRGLRSELARTRNLPPYMVFHDATLKAMAEKKPANLDELGEVNGVGKAKLESYGFEFLQLINNE